MRGSRVDSRLRFASGEVQILAGLVPSRMAERAAKTPGGAGEERSHTVLSRLLSAMLLLWLCCSPAPARAWTRTAVEGSRAHVDVASDGSLLVTLMVDLRIRGGWLSRFDLEGLSPELELDPDKPVWLVSEEGEKYAPTAKLNRNGRISVSFPSRKVAPWRGRYELGLRYRTRAPMREAVEVAGDRVRLRWGLPVWPTSLRDVRVEVNAPAGSTAVPDPAGAHVVSAEQRKVGERTLLRWERLNLPRTVAWDVAVDIPSRALDGASGAPARPDLRSFIQPTVTDATEFTLGCILLLLGLLKRASVAARCRRSGLLAQPLIPVPARWLRWALMAVLCAGGGLVMQADPVVATAMQGLGILLAVDRHLRRGQALPTSVRPASEFDLAQARLQRWLRHASAGAWLDVTTLLGAAALGGACALTWAMEPAHGLGAAFARSLVLAAPLWLTATRRHGPPAAEDTLLRLAATRELLTEAPGVGGAVGCDAQLSIRVAAGGLRRGAQLTLELPNAVAGLRSLQLVVADVDWLDTVRGELCWRVVAGSRSPAAAAAMAALRCTPRPTGAADTLVWLAPSVAPREELDTLNAWFTGGANPHTEQTADVHAAA